MASSPLPSLRPSACPALTRIVVALDGGLCRVKLPGGSLRADQAIAVADATDAHASGVVELTNRANLQLRGVKAGHETSLSRQLAQAGLGPQSVSPDTRGNTRQAAVADDISNLMLSPCAGRDAHALQDTEPLARQILSLLQNEPRFAALSPKFSVLLDGGERLAALEHPHDLWLAAMDPARDPEPWFAFGLAGEPSAVPGGALAAVRSRDVPALVHALLQTFVELAAPEEKRMRDLLCRQAPDALADHAAGIARVALRQDNIVSTWRRAPADPLRRFGAHQQKAPPLWHVGGQPRLGRIDSATLRGLARLARTHGRGSLRITPWQGVLVPDVAVQAVREAERELNRLGFMLDSQNPLARLVACTGSTGCGKGLADTKADAMELAKCLPETAEVHLSGCMRSCAAAHCAPHTLLAVAPGHYDLYGMTAAPDADRHDDTARFGQRIASHLTIEEAARQIGQAARSTFRD